MSNHPTPKTAPQNGAPETPVRTRSQAGSDEKTLGPLKNLPGVWVSIGKGWNMIALPFSQPSSSNLGYRLLLNQYNEILNFSIVDKNVPNRGIPKDQLVAALDYEQTITQIAGASSPEASSPKTKTSSAETNSPEPPLIHHEAGLWLHMHEVNKGTIARLATIPHGNSVLALGKSSESTGTFPIPDICGLPIKIGKKSKSQRDAKSDLNNDPYLMPYNTFHKKLFKGFFTPVFPNRLLNKANEGVTITNVTTLNVEAKNATGKNETRKKAVGGINNIPFVVKQADATKMESTFWIMEIEDSSGPKLRLQYTQTVFLKFAGFLWPHVSICTLEKVS